MVLQGIAFGGSLLSIWLTGRKSLWGPILGAVGFLPWSFLAYSSHLYGMIAFNAVLTGLHIRNIILWRHANA